MTLIKMCEARGLRKCRVPSKTWARIEWQGHGDVRHTKVLAFCDKCLAADTRVVEVLGPVTVTRKEIA